MAARINSPTHDARTRLKIKTSQLINRLQSFALGDEKIMMSSDQVRAALGLLKKTLPDLQSITLGGESEQPLVVQIVKFSEKDCIPRRNPASESREASG
jgi:hypothetical protein